MLDNKMTCPLQTDNTDILLDYCSRSLDPDRRAMFERHMVHCSECREMASAQSEIWMAMDAFEAEPVSADFDQKLYARIDRLEHVPVWEKFWAPVRSYLQGQPAWKPVLSVAAASAALAVVFFVRTDVMAPQPLPAINVQEVVEAEKALEDLDMLGQLETEAPQTEKETI